MVLNAPMSSAALDKWIWVLVYGGLLLLSLGLFVKRSDAGLGWTLIGLGAVVALAGAVLVWVRSRMLEAPAHEQERP